MDLQQIVRRGRTAVKNVLDNENNPLGPRIHVNATDNWGLTLLHYAAQEGDIRVATLLLERGADVNAANNGRTPLHYAAAGEDLVQSRFVRMLLRDRGIVDEELGARFVRLLLDHGANANAVMTNGETPLHRAASEAQEIEIAEALLDNDANNRANINSATNDGVTPLHMAAQHGKIHFVHLFLERGADIGATTDRGMTAMHLAAAYGCLEIVRFLVEFLANPEAAHGRAVNMIAATTNDGETALHRAAAGGHLEVVKFLCRNGAHMNAVAASGVTPLHLAAEKMRHMDLVRFLVEQSIGEEFVYALRSTAQEEEDDHCNLCCNLL